jgi:hypothetical protein
MFLVIASKKGASLIREAAAVETTTIPARRSCLPRKERRNKGKQ